MTQSLVTVSYITAAGLFILSLAGLNRPETAKRGNTFGIIGMFLAIVATAMSAGVTNYTALGVAVIPGAIIGAIVAARVVMTAMPQLVAILHSFVGLAAVLVGLSSYLSPVHALHGAELTIHNVEVYIGIFVGAITFTGSVVAFGKLQGSITGRPILLPGRHVLNALAILASLWLGGMFLAADGTSGLAPLLIMTAIASLLGIHFVVAIGGADMPVVVSMLNSYSGWAAAAAGFMLANDLLIVTGALVGSSGAILSYIMCRAMNRSFFSVILGGFGTADTKATVGEPVAGEATSIEPGETADLLRQARSVIIVPGYGMAVAAAQHPIRQMMDVLRKRHVNVRFAIHPVAGRLPGHMNVLLAEAKIPYDIVLEMDDINPDMHDTDVVLVIGANDIVNPSALTDPNSPIAGMPVLEVWKARTVVVLKRSLASGYAGVDNPLFYNENTRMLFGDARKNVEAVLAKLTAS